MALICSGFVHVSTPAHNSAHVYCSMKPIKRFNIGGISSIERFFFNEG